MPEFLSLFAGAGGLDLGLERSGWRCLYGVDSDPEAVTTLRRNQGSGFAPDALFATSKADSSPTRPCPLARSRPAPSRIGS